MVGDHEVDALALVEPGELAIELGLDLIKDAGNLLGDNVRPVKVRARHHLDVNVQRADRRDLFELQGLDYRVALKVVDWRGERHRNSGERHRGSGHKCKEPKGELGEGQRAHRQAGQG